MIIEINTQSIKPIYEQLRDQIVLGIASKQFMPGESLPSVRRLAADLGINLHTANKAYTTLCDEGYIKMDRRKGAIIADDVSDDKYFLINLTHKLELSAAEARCKKIDEHEFIELCRACYQNTGEYSLLTGKNSETLKQ